jgi:hypothetical protein
VYFDSEACVFEVEHVRIPEIILQLSSPNLDLEKAASSNRRLTLMKTMAKLLFCPLRQGLTILLRLACSIW